MRFGAMIVLVILLAVLSAYGYLPSALKSLYKFALIAIGA